MRLIEYRINRIMLRIPSTNLIRIFGEDSLVSISFPSPFERKLLPGCQVDDLVATTTSNDELVQIHVKIYLIEIDEKMLLRLL